MSITTFRVSERGQTALPAEVRRRWNLVEGGSIEIADLGDALVIVPAARGGVRGYLRRAVEHGGGYSALVREVAADEPDLA